MELFDQLNKSFMDGLLYPEYIAVGSRRVQRLERTDRLANIVHLYAWWHNERLVRPKVTLNLPKRQYVLISS